MGSPKQGYTRYLCESELQVRSLASLLIAALTDRQAREKFGVPAERLSLSTRKDLGLQFEDALKGLTDTFYQKLHRIANPSDDQLAATADRLLTDQNTISQPF
jgi:hypothetical protein